MLFAVFLVVLGALGLASGIQAISRTRKVHSWPVVPGRILERTIAPSTTTGAQHAGRYYEPRVKYAYTVEGKSYTGQRIGLLPFAYDASTARRVVNKLPEAVEVHYNPGAPGDAYLQPSAMVLGILLVIGSALGVLIGAGLVLAKLF
jgi:hypothetical protein